MSYYRIPWTGVRTRLNRALNPAQAAGGSASEQGVRQGWVFSAQAVGGPSAIPPTTYTRYTAPSAGTYANVGVDWYGDRVAASPGTASPWTDLPITGGMGVAISAYFRWGGSTYATPITPYVRFHDGAGNWVGAAITFDPVNVNTPWTRIGITTVAPAGATHVIVNFRATASISYPAGAWFGYTGLLIEVMNSVGTYFDGNTVPATPIEYYGWIGTANSSRSEQTAPSEADTLTPLMDVIAPFSVSRESRVVVRQLLESATTRSVWYSPGLRAGTLRAGFANGNLALNGMSFFTGNYTYYLDHADAYADMKFAVADGALSLDRDEIVGTTLDIPFREIS